MDKQATLTKTYKTKLTPLWIEISNVSQSENTIVSRIIIIVVDDKMSSKI